MNIKEEKIIEFEQEYLKALEEEKEIFIFAGQEVLTMYAKYMLQAYQGILEKQKNKERLK